ncbi:hypothetical protein WN51_00781 [Melipona quadrifasciata]|uniref:Uncharacterized protein n=1 Tax=Melipona quadrifasciata TaxID=166423 RepID=A0A0N0BFB3_9HYME|nr:hypothetical protein WN51_00781 [Melipona quadrifasciata]
MQEFNEITVRPADRIDITLREWRPTNYERKRSDVHGVKEDAMPAACGHFKVWQQERKVATGLEERQGGKTVSCVTRRVLRGANESRNLIPTSAGKPMASHGGSGDENVLYQFETQPKNNLCPSKKRSTIDAPSKLCSQLKPARKRKKGKRLAATERFGEVILMINNYKPRAPFGTTYSAEEETRGGNADTRLAAVLSLGSVRSKRRLRPEVGTRRENAYGARSGQGTSERRRRGSSRREADKSPPATKRADVLDLDATDVLELPPGP